MSDWKQAKLENFVELITDYVANGSFASLKANVQIYKEPNYALMVKTADFANDFTKSLTYTDKHGYGYLSKSRLFGGELLLSNIGSVGKVFRVPHFDRPMTLASNSIMIRCKEELHYKWLYYFFLSPIGNQMLNSITTGTTMKKFNKTGLRGLIIPVPADEEKKRIVARIEELFSELDNGVETLRKTKQQLAVYRQAVLQEAFSICSHEIALSSACAHITDGDHMPPPKAATGVPFIMISNIKGNEIDFTETAFVSSEYFENIGDKRRPQMNDILYTVTGSFGIPVLVDSNKEFCFQRHIALLRPNGQILPRYLFYAMQTPNVYAQATKKATGTAQKTVGLTVLRNMRIPYAESREVQNKVVEDIDARMSVCDSIEKTVDTALQQAEAMRQSILKQAFEGRL